MAILYKELPAPELLEVHGVWGLEPGFYKIEPEVKPKPEDMVLRVNTTYCMWYMNDVLHHEKRPSVEYADGGFMWYLFGKKHRVDGPAIKTDICYEWFHHGVRHREDGPAIEWADGDKAWYHHGELLSEKSIEELKAEFNKRKGG